MFCRVYYMAYVCLFTAAFAQEPFWNSLKVKWNEFKDIPRTTADAVREGFTVKTECTGNPKFRGIQYSKENDIAVLPLYDVNGYIAGLQTSIPKDLSGGYPPSEIKPPFIEDGDRYMLTVYFVDPAIICRRGRSEQQFRSQGTGTDLFIQTGDNPETNLFEVAHNASESTWVEGKCFPGMGLHYYKTMALDMRCDTTYPVATLYYNGRLTAFIWQFPITLNSTNNYIEYEYVANETFQYVVKEVPLCVKDLPLSSGLHIYFEKDPSKYTCQSETPTTPSPNNKECTSGSRSCAACIITLMISVLVAFKIHLL